MMLDDVDRRGFYRDFLAFGEKLASEYNSIGEVSSPLKDAPIIVSGMGGSGVIGNILKDYLHYSNSQMIIVNKSHELPPYINKDYLLIAISFSGNTMETLAVVDEAVRRGINTITISTGGKLAEYSKKKSITHITVSSAMAPRSGLPQLLAAALRIVESNFGIRLRKDVEEAHRYLKYVVNEWRPVEKSKPWLIANELLDYIPVLYVSHNLTSIAIRAKASFNENAKIPFYWDMYPEIYHNEVMIYEGSLRENIRPMFIGGSTKLSSLYDIIVEKGMSPLSVEYPADVGRLAAILKLILLFDLCSIYHAVMRGVDPYPVDLITRLKEL
jgi:glucose/mannose-6-phosphate isomerase